MGPAGRGRPVRPHAARSRPIVEVMEAHRYGWDQLLGFHAEAGRLAAELTELSPQMVCPTGSPSTDHQHGL